MNNHWTRRKLLQAAAGACGAIPLPALASAMDNKKSPAPLPQARPEDLGIDPLRLQVAYDLMKKWTNGPEAPIPGGAILVGRFGKTVAPRFFGRQGPEPDAEPLRPDAMFYMASVTKPVIFTCAMLLVERGLLNLSDKVVRYLPEFIGNDKESAQVLNFFTHTSGLADELPNNARLRRDHSPLSTFVKEALKSDLAFKPGTRLSYSSLATILVAEIVQRISGLTIREFVKKEIVTPLGLQSTGLGSQGFKHERIVRTTVPEYQSGGDFGWNSRYWQEFGSPAGGLFSTPEDYAAICATMLNNGRFGNLQLLSPASARRMTSNRLHDLPDLPEPVRRTQPWGLGWRLNHPGHADSWGDLLNNQVFGHTGSSGNLVWMDPETNGFCILFSNYLRSRAPWRLVHLSNAIASSFMPI